MHKRKFEFLFKKILDKYYDPKFSTIEEVIKSWNDTGKLFGMGKSCDPYPVEVEYPFQQLPRSLKSELIKNEKVLGYILLYKYSERHWGQLKDAVYSKTELVVVQDHRKIIANSKVLSNAEKNKIDQLPDEKFAYILRKFITKSLKDKFRDLVKNETRTKYKFEKYYLKCCLTYAGYSNERLFETEFLEFERNVEAEKNDIKNNSRHNPNEIKALFYHGYYYHFPKNEIGQYTLNLTPEVQSETAKGQMKFIAKVKNLHEINEVYEGTAISYHVAKKILIRSNALESNNPLDFIQMLLFFEGKKVDQYDSLMGMIWTTSTKLSHPIAVETILLKDTASSKTPWIADNVKRFFFLRRPNLIARPHGVDKKLKARKIEVNRLCNIVGIWRMWMFDSNWNIETAILHVREDYRTICYVERRGKLIEHRCGIDIVKNDKTVVSFTGYNGQSITRHFLIKYPINNENIVSGSFISYPKFDPNRAIPLMRVISLRKESKELSKYFDAKGNQQDTEKLLNDQLGKFKDIEQLQDFIGKDIERKELFEEFVEFNKANGISSIKGWF